MILLRNNIRVARRFNKVFPTIPAPIYSLSTICIFLLKVFSRFYRTIMRGILFFCVNRPVIPACNFLVAPVTCVL